MSPASSKHKYVTVEQCSNSGWFQQAIPDDCAPGGDGTRDGETRRFDRHGKHSKISWQDPRATFSSTLQRGNEKKNISYLRTKSFGHESRVCTLCVPRALTRAIVFRLKMSSSLEYPRYENKYRIARIYAYAANACERYIRRRANARYGNYRTRRALCAIMIRSSMKPSNGHRIALAHRTQRRAGGGAALVV